MTDRPLIGIILALLVESFRMLKIRWKFDDEAFALAWKLTTLAIVFTGVLMFLDGRPDQATPKLLTWLPLLLLPMQFVQAMGMRESMPLITFSFLAKQRRLRNIRLGLTEEMIHLNFGNVYFVATLVASTLGSRSGGWFFLPGIIVLSGWMLLSASRSRPLSLLVALSVAGGIALGGQYGLEQLNNWLSNRSPSRDPGFDPDSGATAIGRPGTIVQSPGILWRIKPAPRSSPPRLLRKASYNTFGSSTWIINPTDAKIFNDLDTVTADGKPSYIVEQYPGTSDPILAVRESLPRFSMRGAALADSPLPLPGDVSSLADFQLDGIEHNALGTTQVAPKQAVIDGTVAWKGDSRAEFLPYPEDKIVPHLEHDALRDILAELKFDSLPNLETRLNAIQLWFQTHFRYSRELTISSSRNVSRRPTAITQFLTTERAGHCEYFAAATTLLLREAGIPARYTIGYAVAERDVKRGEYIVRGTHGHAWTRVWDEQNQRWIDFDTTPASWIPAVAKINPPMQAFDDTVKRLREDFLLWRNRPGNRLGVTLAMSAIALGVIGFVFKRLWKSRQRLEETRRSNGYDGAIRLTPLNALEKPLEKQLGQRPLGQPLSRWLASLPTPPAFLDEALKLHQRLRFDPSPASPADEARLADLARQLEATLKK
ncbi:MAG: transglutaminase-like domain-containing protein [Verrucomicrobiota bacterium]